MRYCKNCGHIYTTEGNVCAPCNEKTRDMGVFDQEQLFDEPAEDKARSIFLALKTSYDDAVEAADKAAAKSRRADADAEKAGRLLIDYQEVWDRRAPVEDEGEGAAPPALLLLPSPSVSPSDAGEDEGGDGDEGGGYAFLGDVWVPQ